MDSCDHSDQELLVRYGAGDESAFAAIISRHRDMVRRSCSRRLGCHDADDATQAVFLILSRKPKEAARHGCLAAWLMRTAQLVCANASRQQRTRRAFETRAAQEAPMVVNPDDRDPEEETRLRAMLDAAIDRLPEEQRRVLILHYFAGLGYDAIASQLGCPVNTVATRLHRALGKLRDRLAPATAAGLSLPSVPALLLASERQPLPPRPLPEPTAAAHALATSIMNRILMIKLSTVTAILVAPIAGVVIGSHLMAADPPQVATPPTLPTSTPTATIVSELVPELGVTPELNAEGINLCREGFKIRTVNAGSTAKSLGLRPGDIIVRCDGRPAGNQNLLVRAVAAAVVGNPLQIDILRDGVPVTLQGEMRGRPRREVEMPVPLARFRDGTPLAAAFYAGGAPADYEAAYDLKQGGALRYQAVVKQPADFGTWMTMGPRSLRLAQVLGKRVRFSAEIRCADVAKGCSLWIRTDAFVGDSDCYEMPSFDNGMGRQLSGTCSWTRYAVVVDVPRHATALAYGLLLDGPGTMWVRGAVLETVSDDVASTSMTAICASSNLQSRRAYEAAQAETAPVEKPNNF